ncbi:MAG: DMT family transporter [Eubacteriales bacterium]
MDGKELISQKSKAYIQLIITAFGWALSTILIKLYVGSIPPFHLLMGRFFLGSLFIFFTNPKAFLKVKKSELKTGGILGSLLFIVYSLGVSALIFTSASKSGFLIALTVLFIPIMESRLKKVWPSKWTAISVLCSIIGLKLIAGINGTSFNFGDFLSILCAIVSTAYIIVLDRLGKDKNDLILTEIQLITVTIISFIAALIFEGFNFQLLISNIVVLVIMGVLGTGITTLFQTRAQKVASSESVGIILLGEPLFTLIMAYFILGETILLSGFIGSMLLLASLVIAIIKRV